MDAQPVTNKQSRNDSNWVYMVQATTSIKKKYIEIFQLRLKHIDTDDQN